MRTFISIGFAAMLTLGVACSGKPTITVENATGQTIFQVSTCGTTIDSLADGASHVFECEDGSHPTSFSYTDGGQICTTAAAPTVDSNMDKTANINPSTVVNCA